MELEHAERATFFLEKANALSSKYQVQFKSNQFNAKFLSEMDLSDDNKTLLQQTLAAADFNAADWDASGDLSDKESINQTVIQGIVTCAAQEVINEFVALIDALARSYRGTPDNEMCEQDFAPPFLWRQDLEYTFLG